MFAACLACTRQNTRSWRGSFAEDKYSRPPQSVQSCWRDRQRSSHSTESKSAAHFGNTWEGSSHTQRKWYGNRHTREQGFRNVKGKTWKSKKRKKGKKRLSRQRRTYVRENLRLEGKAGTAWLHHTSFQKRLIVLTGYKSWNEKA